MDIAYLVNFLIENQLHIPAGVFLFCFLIQLFFYLGIYSRLTFYTRGNITATSEPVSVIICARNEAENLGKYLPVVLSQQYPDFEVIVVDDGSSDETEEVLRQLKAMYPHLRTTTIREDKKFSHSKKLAVTIGIKAAKNDILVFTDADCEPAGNQWLSGMVSRFTGGKEIVLGYGGYFSRKGLLNKYIRYDTLIIAMQYLSFAISGFPYMGVGRNIAYRKSFFNATKGFTRHLHLLSGDDDLFVNENATRRNTTVECSHQSHTRSDPGHSIRQWIRQKKRHLTTAPLYKFRDKFLLLLEPVSRFIFYGLFAALLFFPEISLYVLGVFAFRLIIQLIIIKNAMIRLKENNLLLYSLLFDVFALFINFVIFVSNRISVRNRPWK
ncbi:MAG: glycosyltransferase [Bacteroidales bacterium]|nr:glycosyltransferase [Bacteroidales bacterium]